MIQIFPLENIPIIQNEKDLWSCLLSGLESQAVENDVLVLAHTPLSRVFGNIHDLNSIKPSQKAIDLSKELNKPPEKVEVIIQASSEIIKVGRNVIITQNHAGIICANAGVDESNAGIGKVVTIPNDPDLMAEMIHQKIKDELNMTIPVIISDTVGRALRKGAVNIAIGNAGFDAMRSEIGKTDLFGYVMKVSEVAIADEIASAAELIQGQTNEAKPFVIVRGVSITNKFGTNTKYLNRPKNERLFT